jgi:type I restriction enzyme S subunit
MGDTLNATSLALVLIPIPPLAEQHRIVAKVDELIALCDQLEQQQEDSVRTHASLVETLLGALTAASERGAFAEAWQRIASHFDTLFTTESSIEQLKQTILQLAVMGKLVEQDPEDEPAAVLLKKIASEQAKLAKAGTIKSEKFAPQISEEEFSIQIPNGWALARFQALPLFYHVGLDRGKSEQGINKKYRYFKMNNILNTGGFDLSDIVSVDASEEEVEKFSLASGDLLFNTRNSQELVGKTCVFRDDGNGAILYNNNILRARFSIQPISVVLDLWMRSPAGKSELEKLKSGTTNVWAIYQGKLEGLVCPIPPLAEQYRIVAKVDELMALCDRLKTSLQSAQTTKLHLADNLVEAAIR